MNGIGQRSTQKGTYELEDSRIKVGMCGKVGEGKVHTITVLCGQKLVIDGANVSGG